MKNTWRVFCLSFCVLLSLTACRPNTEQQVHAAHCVKQATLPVKYAKGFTVDYYNGFKVISVRSLTDSLHIVAQYVLLPPNKNAPDDFKEAVLLDTPARKVVCISTNHIAALERLGLIDSVAAVANINLVYSKEAQKRIINRTIVDIGTNELNYEKIAQLQPSFVFTSGDWDGGDKMKIKLNALHIPLVLNLDYAEQHPLARAEWIKFVAAFYDRESEADSIFAEIENRYVALKQKANAATTHPTVFVNIPFKEIWYMPCGANYMAQLINDADGDFLWHESAATNGLNLNLDYEAVYAKANEANYWLNTGFAKSLHELERADKKNKYFAAFKNRQVYNNNFRNTASGGFDFWESGAVNPDKILADLIFIFHPELLPNHRLYYYQHLQ